MKYSAFFMVLSALPTCLLFQAASPEYVFGAFLTAAALSALYTLPSRNGRIYTLFTALSAPFWLLAFVTECVSFYFFSKSARFFPDYPIAIVLIFALCALLIGIRGRRGIERLSVLIGLTMLLLAFISLFTAGPAGEGQRSLYLFFLPSITVAACCTAAEKARPGGVLTGILISFAVYLGLYFSQSNLLLSEIAVITGAVFRSAVIALAALKTIKPRLWAR